MEYAMVCNVHQAGAVPVRHVWVLRKLLGKGGGGHFLEELNLSENSFSVESFECEVLRVGCSNL